MINRNMILFIVLLGLNISCSNNYSSQKEKYDFVQFNFNSGYDTTYYSLVKSGYGDTAIFQKFAFSKEDDWKIRKGSLIGQEYAIATNGGYIYNNIFFDTTKIVNSDYYSHYKQDGCDSILISVLKKGFDTTINSVKISNCNVYKIFLGDCSHYNFPNYILSYFDINKKIEVLKLYHVYKNPIIHKYPDGKESIKPYDSVYFNNKDTVVMNIPTLIIRSIICNETMIKNDSLPVSPPGNMQK